LSRFAILLSSLKDKKNNFHKLTIKENKLEDITGYLAKQSCYCLNENPLSPHSNLFVGDGTLALKSYADEQQRDEDIQWIKNYSIIKVINH
jgi:hypothetical protein